MQTESLILTFFVNLVLGEQMQKKYNISPEDDQVMGEVIPLLQPFKAGKPWQFAGSFYYATTVLTTIGYGHSTPKTDGGRLFTIIYSPSFIHHH